MNERITLLVILSTLFISIIIFSFSGRDTIITYKFSDSITIDNTNKEDAKIGVVIIDNKKYLPERSNLDNLKACIFNENFKFTYDVYYSESKNDYSLGKNDFRTGNIIETPTLTKKKVSMKLTLEYPLLENNFENNLYYNEIPKTKTLYIFLEDNFPKGKFQEFCENVNPENATYLVPIINNI